MPRLELTGDDGELTSRALGPTKLVIGRARTADLVLRHPRVSSRHLEVWTEAGKVWVEDLGARNGTTINELALEGRAALRPGDALVLGGAVTLRLVDDEEEPQAAAYERDAALEGLAAVARYAGAAREGALLQSLVDDVAALAEVPIVWALRWSDTPAESGVSIDAMATAGSSPDAPDPTELSQSILARAAREGRAVWADDAVSEPGMTGVHSVQALQLRSVGCVPLGDHGALWVSDPELPDRFDPALRARIEALCTVAAGLVEAPTEPAADTPGRAPRVKPIPGVVGQAPPMVALAQSVHAFAPMPWPVLILGETGTGKELVARGIHELSGVRGDFLAINCGAIPESLAESTIFGHERGAFTGADRRHQGVVERVGRGTLFLDEVGDLPSPLQVKLLRLLQEGTYTPVGATRPQTFHGRILAATHRAIDTPEGRATFREDLYYRLAACVVRVPALRERREDLPALAEHLLARAVGQLPGIDGLRLHPKTVAQLRLRDWPGNVRELENTIRPAIARCVAAGASELMPEHLIDARPLPTAAGSGQPWEVEDLMEATELFQRERVRKAILDAEGNRSKACEQLGVSRQWLYRLLARWPDHGL